MTARIFFIFKNILHIFYIFFYPTKNIDNIPKINIIQNNTKNIYTYQSITHKVPINHSEIITNTNTELFWPSTEIIIPLIISSVIVLGVVAYIIYSGNVPNFPELPEHIISQNIKQTNNYIIENVRTELDDILTPLSPVDIYIIEPFNHSINNINGVLIYMGNSILDYSILYKNISEDSIRNILNHINLF
jgi:hypothetical protein